MLYFGCGFRREECPIIRQSDWVLLTTLHQYKSITKTAEALFLTQPALTKRLQQLEEEFGVQIAQRTAGGLDFTVCGEYIVQYAANMLEEYDELKSTLHQAPGKVLGTLHIASCNSLARFVLPGLLGQFKEKYPHVEFEVSGAFSYQVSQMVNTHKAQIGFIRGEHPNSCCKKLIGRQQACVVFSRPFTLDELPSLPRIDFYSDQMATARIDSWWYDRFSIPPNIAMTVSSGSTCYEMVRHGLGYAIFLSTDFIRDRSGLTVIPLFDKQAQPIIRNDWMIYRKRSLELELVHSFISFSNHFFANSVISEVSAPTEEHL